MEFNLKLQELRKQRGITQEELAKLLFVSRTAVSKWESGRGYPNLDSLKAIAKLFNITIDELLSGEEILVIAEETTKQKQQYLHNLIYALLDCSCILLLFLPIYAQKAAGVIKQGSLLFLTQFNPYLKIAYIFAIIATICFGILMFALQNFNQTFWLRSKNTISIFLNICSVILFIISQQPYPAVFLFVFLIIKVLLLIKK